MQKLSTIQINLLRAPHCLDHPGGSGPEVCQGQPEADSELALSPVFSPKWVVFCDFSSASLSLSLYDVRACVVVAASRAEIVCHAFYAYLDLV